MTTYSPLPGTRNITLRTATWSGTRDSFTGQRVPTFAESTISGVLIERTGDMPAFAAGTLIVQNAVLFTRDTVHKLDEILADSKYYKVQEIHEEYDTDAALVYRACHLQLLDIHIWAA